MVYFYDLLRRRVEDFLDVVDDFKVLLLLKDFFVRRVYFPPLNTFPFGKNVSSHPGIFVVGGTNVYVVLLGTYNVLLGSGFCCILPLGPYNIILDLSSAALFLDIFSAFSSFNLLYNFCNSVF